MKSIIYPNNFPLLDTHKLHIQNYCTNLNNSDPIPKRCFKLIRTLKFSLVNSYENSFFRTLTLFGHPFTPWKSVHLSSYLVKLVVITLLRILLTDKTRETTNIVEPSLTFNLFNVVIQFYHWRAERWHLHKSRLYII